MSLKDLQERVRRSHERHFGSTSRAERLRDLQHQIAELAHHRDDPHLREELGDAAWALLQLANELDLSLDDCVGRTLDKLDRQAQGKQIALLGTSANPITNAHLTMGLEVLALTDVDEVWLYLVGKHAWGKKLMPGHHRLEMARRATARYKRLKVCDFEIAHVDTIYEESAETSHIMEHHFLPAFPEYNFCWIMGSDVAQTFHQWDGHLWLAEHMRIFIIHRLGYDFDKENSPLADDKHIYLRENIVTSNISSTLVRQRGRAYEQELLMALVPDVVWDYLEEHRLLDPEMLQP